MANLLGDDRAGPLLSVSGAVRVDHEAGTVHELAFVRPASDPVFTCVDRPAGAAPAGAVLVCPPLYVVTNARRETMLARGLAARGLAVQRFDYPGTGNSGGDPAATTFGGLCEVARRLAEGLARTCSGAPVAILGTQFGALVAAAVAASLDDAPLVLWQPAVRGAALFRDGFRAGRMRDLKHPAGASLPASDAAAQLQTGQPADLLGFRVEPGLYQSLQDVVLTDLLGDRPRPALVVQMGPGRTLRGELAAAAEHCRRMGSSVDVSLIVNEESWWFPSVEAPPHEEIMAMTTEWLMGRIRGGDDR
jgi:hypothetical protein